MVCEPLVAVPVFQAIEYGGVVTTAPLMPSSWNCTPTTPTLSEALAVTVIVPETLAPDAGEVMLTVGAVVSLNTVTVTGAEVVRLPAASRATAVRVCEPLLAEVVFQETEQGAAVTSTPLTPSSWNCTPATPTLSEALALTVIVPETLAPEAGEVMLTVGAVASKLTLLSVLVEAVFGLPAASCATPAARVAITVPAVVMPETATL